jgi:hypothetical protein
LTPFSQRQNRIRGHRVAALGLSQADLTQVYAERDQRLAAKIG